MDRDLVLRRRLDQCPQFKRACCQDTHNLRYPINGNSDLNTVTLVCKVCKAKHYRMYAGKVRV